MLHIHLSFSKAEEKEIKRQIKLHKDFLIKRRSVVKVSQSEAIKAALKLGAGIIEEQLPALAVKSRLG